MRYISQMRLSKELVSETGGADKIIKDDIKRQKISALKKGRRLFFASVQLFEHDMDNFVRNLVTVQCVFYGFKIPRIVKRILV